MHKLPSPLFIALVLFQAITGSHAQSQFEPSTEAHCNPLTGCGAVISEVDYNGHKAYRFGDAHSEAIVVPDLGRVMSYRLIDGANVLWTATRHKFAPGEWKNYGGAKTWPSPQDSWPALIGRKWPPPEEWDRTATSDVLSGGTLRLTSVIDPVTGTRLIREFGLADDGDLVISQTVEKMTGLPVTLGIWSIAQTPTPDFVLVPQTVHGTYAGYHWLDKPAMPPVVAAWNDGVLQVSPTLTSASNLVADASEAWIVSVAGDVAFAQSSTDFPIAEKQANYSGTFPVAFYCTGPQKEPYAELELLSPLHRFVAGSRWKQTQHWRLESLPSADGNNPATHSALVNFVEVLRANN